MRRTINMLETSSGYAKQLCLKRQSLQFTLALLCSSFKIIWIFNKFISQNKIEFSFSKKKIPSLIHLMGFLYLDAVHVVYVYPFRCGIIRKTKHPNNFGNWMRASTYASTSHRSFCLWKMHDLHHLSHRCHRQTLYTVLWGSDKSLFWNGEKIFIIKP